MGKIIELKNVRKSFDGRTDVVEDFSLDIMEGEFVTFLGPSGCGKTTILRMIGGFDTQTSGEILLDGSDISLLPPYERPINTVFQKYALFPHLNVYDNIAFGLKLKKMPKTEIAEKVRHVLELVDLEGFEKRSVTTLSGGQQQRIAIARAIVNEPRVLLLDEPLSALDYKMRKEMQVELKEIHKKLGITFIFVTHDQEEALGMSDKVVVMSKGRIQQVGSPEKIYNEPANVFVADFIGESNIFNGIMEEDRKAAFAGNVFQTVDDYPQGTRIDAVIRPEDFDIVGPDEGMLKGKVLNAEFRGTFYDTAVLSGNYELQVQTFKYYEPGSMIGLSVDPDMIHIIKYDDTINHFLCQITAFEEGLLTIENQDVTVKIPFSRVFPGAFLKGNALYDEKGELDWKKSLTLVYEPSDGIMSDDPEKGLIRGHIVSFYYIGDHYSYIIRSESGTDYAADDKYLWNAGDEVSIDVSADRMKFFMEG